MLLFFSCKTKSTEEEKFADFDKRFHSDSLFQISRIVFPLKGGIIDGFDRKSWLKKDWQMIKIPVIKTTVGSDYKLQTSFNDTLVTEKVWIESSGFSFERHFKNIEGKWFLIFCKDVNL